MIDEHDPGDEDRCYVLGGCPFCGRELRHTRGRPWDVVVRPQHRNLGFVEALEHPDLTASYEVIRLCRDPSCIDQANAYVAEVSRSKELKELRAEAEERALGRTLAELRLLVEMLSDEHVLHRLPRWPVAAAAGAGP